MKNLIAVILIISIAGCIPPREECTPDFVEGEEVKFKADTSRTGIVTSSFAGSCTEFWVSYFDNRGENQTEIFISFELIKLEE